MKNIKFDPFVIVSLLSWGLLVATALASFGKPEESVIDLDLIVKRIKYNKKYFWMTFSVKSNTLEWINSYLPFPLIMNYTLFYICYITMIALIVASCAVIIIGLIKSEYTSGMFQTFSRFHFVPVLCIAAIFIVGESLADDNSDKDYQKQKDLEEARHIFNIIFTVIGLCSLIFIHYKTNISFKVVNIIIKQCTYGWLIVMLLYNLLFDIHLYGNQKNNENIGKDEYIKDFTKKCSLAFSIVMGIVNLGIAFLLKNVGICLANFAVYLGLTIWFFDKDDNETARPNKDAEGAIDIVQMVLSCVLLVFLIYKYKSKVLG